MSDSLRVEVEASMRPASSTLMIRLVTHGAGAHETYVGRDHLDAHELVACAEGGQIDSELVFNRQVLNHQIDATFFIEKSSRLLIQAVPLRVSVVFHDFDGYKI